MNNYIKSVEEDTLSEYPLQIQSTGLDMTSMMLGAAAGGNAGGDGSQEAGEDQVRVSKMLTNMLSSIGSNDLAALKQYFDSGESDIDQYTNAIEYSYNATPQIYSSNTENVRQVNPDKSFTSLGLGSTSSSNSLMSMSMSTDMFSEMPSDPDLYQNQYDVKAGRWPEAENEIVLVLTKNGSISDLMQYTLGLRDASELDRMVEQFAAEEDVETPDDIHPYSYDDILSVTFKLVNAADFYQHDEEFGVWKDKSDDKDFVRSLVEDGEDLHVVGVVQPREDASATMLSAGLYYPSSLTRHVIDEAAASQIVKDQLAKPDINVFTGKPFGEEEDGESTFGMESLFTIDGDAIQAAFTIDESKLAVDMSSALNLQGSLQNMPEDARTEHGRDRRLARHRHSGRQGRRPHGQRHAAVHDVPSRLRDHDASEDSRTGRRRKPDGEHHRQPRLSPAVGLRFHAATRRQGRRSMLRSRPWSTRTTSRPKSPPPCRATSKRP